MTGSSAIIRPIEHTAVVATEATASFGSNLPLGRVKWVEREWQALPDERLLDKLDALKGEETVSFANTAQAIRYLRSLAR